MSEREAHSGPSLCWSGEAWDALIHSIDGMKGYCVQLRFHDPAHPPMDVIVGCVVDNDDTHEQDRLECWAHVEDPPHGQNERGALLYYDLDAIESIYVY